MIVIDINTSTTDRKTAGCPGWCVNDHLGDDVTIKEFNRIEHFGHVEEIPGDGFGEEEVVAHVELYCFQRPDGERSDIGVTTWCDSTLTKEQAATYAAMIQRASHRARALVVPSAA